MMRGAVATAFVLQCVGVVRVYDLIVAMTGGGPGISTKMPAVYVIDMITSSQNVGQGMAAATMMLVPIIVLLSVLGIVGWRAAGARRVKRHERAATSRIGDAAAARAAGGGEPCGPKPRRLSPARVGIYAFLIVSALFFLIPLYVMVVTSLKGMPEIRLGHLFNLPAQDHVPAVGRRLAARLHRARLLRPASGLPQLGEDHRAERDRLDRHRRRSTATRCPSGATRAPTCIFGVLVFGAFVPYQVVIYPLIIGFRGARAVLDAGLHHHRAHDLRHADPDAALPQFLRRRCRSSCSRRRASTAPASGGRSSTSWCRCRCRSPSSPSSCR